ncbi:unnamed protein product [Mytilus coruscus]|uniref:Uncharacterized protein n=1 Tax=Mytilus coruscus TaxID=42192 RepID=A0A6J8CRY9_MYTCO|nr:unnamed protein product [Mytilus coruscus]
MCLNHDSVTSSGGCYCNNADCVQNTGKVLVLNIKQKGIVNELHKCDDDDDCIPRCHVPLILSHGHLPCHCDSQDCADNIQVPTTNTPSTTTVPALLQLDPYTCVADNCGKHKAGQLCTPFNDLSVNGGCYCSDSKCVVNANTTTTSTTTESTTPHSTTTPSTTTLTTKTTPSKTTPTTTPSTTTPTTTPTKTPTTTPTTITTVATTTTTTTRTTSISATTTGPRTCHVCGDTTLPVPCSSRQIGRDLSHTCKTGEHYCMTDIVQDDQGNVDVFKRCVDLATCEKKWITESADLDYCKRYGVVKNPYAFSCHFCCTQDKCNSMLVPNATTWYTKTN